MPYPGQFVKLVMIGSLYAEKFNMTLSIVPSALGELNIPAVDDATLQSVAAAVGAWFADGTVGSGPAFTNQSSLESIKLNRVDANGRYVDANTMEWVYPTPILGSSNMGGWPAQISTVATLRTRVSRGRASAGRIFLIPNAKQQTIATDGRLTSVGALQTAQAVVNLIERVNAEYILIGKVGVASGVGAGRFEHVTHVTVGRVLDTMRSRRTSLLEEPEEDVVT